MMMLTTRTIYHANDLSRQQEVVSDRKKDRDQEPNMHGRRRSSSLLEGVVTPTITTATSNNGVEKPSCYTNAALGLSIFGLSSGT